MPELPEVETIRRDMERLAVGKKIAGFEFLDPKLVSPSARSHFLKHATGKKIVRAQRRAKYLLLHLDNGHVFLVHLRMSGRFIFQKGGLTPSFSNLPNLPLANPTPRFSRLQIKLDSGNIFFADPRKFAVFELYTERELAANRALLKLGPEPLEKEFSKERLAAMLAKSGKPIKNFLLDQNRIAGIGNIYASEILFESKIGPKTPAKKIGGKKLDALFAAIPRVLRTAVANRGTSKSDYFDGEGKMGNFQNLLKVYDREGEPCVRCGRTIMRLKQGGRSTYYCPRCQKA